MTERPNTISATRAYSQLQERGYPRSFVEKLLPDWWDNALLQTSAGAFQFAVILKQRFGLNVSFKTSGDLDIQEAVEPRRYKHRADTSDDELQVAANLGLALGQLVAFATKQPYQRLPSDPVALHQLVVEISGRDVMDFEGLLKTAWVHGIPVIFLNELPRGCKRLTGMAVQLIDRPVVVLGLRHQQRARQLFVLAHEVAHILCGHVAPGGVLVDEDLPNVVDAIGAGATSKDREEAEADRFALAAIRNGATARSISLGEHHSPTTLAVAAQRRGKELGIDPGHLILSFAHERAEWQMANQAIDFYPAMGKALELVRAAFVNNIDLERLSKENQDYVFQAQGFRR